MPRANRYIVAGPAYHVTHRCHNRDFLFRFATDRDAYRATLRQYLRLADDVRLLAYCITSNHVHLLVTSSGSDAAVSRMMQSVEGEFALRYNRRTSRSGAFWSGRFHATMIDSGEYLWRCMRYIDLNMVRAGMVQHPGDWAWSGYGEIVGLRKRYRLISLREIMARSGHRDAAAVAAWYRDWMDHASTAERSARDAKWTDSIAVGSRGFVERIGQGVEARMKVEVRPDIAEGWIVRERVGSYSGNSAP